MLGIFEKLLDANQKTLNHLKLRVTKINELESEIKNLTDKGLKTRAEELKIQYQEGKTLDELLPVAFALVRETSRRVNDARLYDVQLMAAAALHEGKIAEQRTGEGKTFSAAPAAFLNALAGEGVHIVTVNDYLARRECGWVGPVYHALGLSCATIIHEASFIYDPEFSNDEAHDDRLKHLRPVSRKEAYSADITYGTNNEFGFDYLRDNMALSLADVRQRGHAYAIVDEVDSILIDEARTPLIISAPAQEATDKYVKFASMISKLKPETDYVVDEKLKTAHLTEEGTLAIEKLLGVDNLYEKDFASLHHLEEALKAKSLFQKDKDYVVKDGEVVIVDEFTGRMMPGRRYSEGLHQAIEAKEGVKIQQESQTLATISFQNYFRLYKKLAGMTGTAATEAEEFHKIYKLDVVIVPTNKPMVRKDESDMIYKTQKAKYEAVVKEIEQVHEKGQPILVGTTSIEKNELLSELLKKRKVSHALLNAKNHEREAEIIAKAGEKGAVTVATNLAGRGVDIKLGNGVDKLGGLYVLGTDRHESRRIDNQLRGRSGRQGDPGKSQFFVSLDDDLMRIFGGEQVSKVMGFLKMPDDVPIQHALVSRAIEGAQKKVEGHNFDIRKHTVEYDDVMNQQRKIIYGVRRQILEAASRQQDKQADDQDKSLRGEILGKVDKEIANIVTLHAIDELQRPQIVEEFSSIIPFDESSKNGLLKELENFQASDQITEFLIKLAHDLYEEREKQIGVETARQMESFVYLNTIDTLWIEHLDTMDDLRSGIGLRGYAQRDPLIEYKREAFDLFERLIGTIDSEVVHRIYKVAVQGQMPISTQPVITATQINEQHAEALDEDQLMEDLGHLIPTTPQSESVKRGETKVTIERNGQIISQSKNSTTGALQSSKVGRNEPCPCGSGLKYKRCGLINSVEHQRRLSSSSVA